MRLIFCYYKLFTTNAKEKLMAERESMEFDVVIVGAGPAGLSAAIRLMQVAQEKGQEVSVCLVEKGSEIGAHTLSGAVLETKALDELLPNWKELGAPLHTEVKTDSFKFLTKKGAYTLPTPPQMNNHGNYIVSLGNVCRWLGEQAEGLGVQIFPGFPAREVLYNDSGEVAGIVTGEFGRAENGEEKSGFQPAMDLKAKFTLFAEGCRGSLGKELEVKYDLRAGVDPQTYGLGIKELWQIDHNKHDLGAVTHTIGWPMDSDTYGGSFLYHLEDNQVSIGFVIGLDYKNPTLSPFEEFQRFKTHPSVRKVLEGGKRISYGARTINEGGYQSIPRVVFPGGALIGCDAGFVNVPKIKGSHTAMKSGMLAAEAVMVALANPAAEVDTTNGALAGYAETLKNSWVYDELYAVRNIRPSFQKGLWRGLFTSFMETYITKGKGKTLHHHADHAQTVPIADVTKINYPKPDGKISFDLLSSVYISNTNHAEDQPVHLQVKDMNKVLESNFSIYGSPESHYCPAGVYERIEEDGAERLQINAQNCVHCKTCDIKDPNQNITWVTPEGGGGPNYPNM
jgi:electron-transferring-flavoprotein dehydrogenase